MVLRLRLCEEPAEGGRPRWNRWNRRPFWEVKGRVVVSGVPFFAILSKASLILKAPLWGSFFLVKPFSYDSVMFNGFFHLLAWVFSTSNASNASRPSADTWAWSRTVWRSTWDRRGKAVTRKGRRWVWDVWCQCHVEEASSWSCDLNPRMAWSGDVGACLPTWEWHRVRVWVELTREFQFGLLKSKMFEASSELSESMVDDRFCVLFLTSDLGLTIFCANSWINLYCSGSI